MPQLTNLVTKWFRREGWNMHRIPEVSGVWYTGYSGRHGDIPCVVVVHEMEKEFIFYSRVPFLIPREQRALVGEFLHRANYGLKIGNFELDFMDGDVRFKTSIDLEGATPQESMIHNAVMLNVLILDRYMTGLTAMLNGDLSPAEAVTSVEGLDMAVA